MPNIDHSVQQEHMSQMFYNSEENLSMETQLSYFENGQS